MGKPESGADMTDEVKFKIQNQIDALKRRMNYDANDLEYETHLHAMRDLQKILDKGNKSIDDKKI
ncbi:aminoglycoside phosphotransferase [Pectinatus frisingensis]|jgi:hypothetical protein|uniref:aminoglycoside phosphotransferase n=1 Tax=Pectinatus frisingensis TaxID=865 RepID=UPI001E2E2540|nr:aminoglycoside phosphotransferase [Pectinatus frisingensis]